MSSPLISMPVQDPFAKLSTALLKAIFDNLCNDPICIPLKTSDHRYILGLVCKRWFNTVWSTCSFWNKVHFTLPPPNATAHQSHPLLKQFEFCMGLSGQNPLTINVDMVCDGWEFSIAHSIIIPHVGQIKTLSCPIYGNTDIETFLKIPEGSFSILESIEVWFINTLTTPASLFPPDARLQFGVFRTAPRLCHATFYLSNGLHPIDLRLPWGQLTILDLGTTAILPGVFMQIMDSAALRLKDASFYIRFSKLRNPRLILSKHSIRMKVLQTLRLRLLFPSRDTRLFSLLQLPSLQNLSIEMHDRFQDWDMALYTKLLRASTSTLQQLYLIDYPPPENTNTGFMVRRRHLETTHVILDMFFEVISNIQNLYLPLGLEVHAATLEKIASCALLPQLCSLEQVGTVNGSSILSMVKQRHMHLLNTSLLVQPEFIIGSSRHPIPKPLGALKYVRMLIPRQRYSTEQKRVLVKEAQALASIGITFHLQSTGMLPLPVMKPRTVG